MYQAQVYDKVYFQDDYKQQFEALRSRYHDRTQKALRGRAVDHTPTSNIAEFYYLHDEPGGGVSLTSGDLVDYFNSRYGGSDRIGAMREALSHAVKKAEKSRELAKKQRSEKARESGVALNCRVRFARGHMVLVNMMFVFMLALSIVLLGASGVMLERSEADVARAELQLAQNEQVQAVSLLDHAGDAENASGAYLNCSNENVTEIYQVEQKQNGIEAFLRALAYLW
ncbi:MAG: hypothetical protein IKA06_07490 [Clostridia bacterium]|nr:hypothetical protein [Clostridia bacterium]